MRLGILGGTFDPVHYGHLLMAEMAREQCQLDQVWLMPAAVPPHKQSALISPGNQRIEMLELAIGGHGPLVVSSDEIGRGGVSFTVDTLAELRAKDSSRELFLIIGADSLADLATWREPARIAELATIVVCGRPGFAIDATPLAGILTEDRLEAIRRHRIEMPLIELSSREIRSRVAHGLSIRYQTPRAVEKYIETQGLYRDRAAVESTSDAPHPPCSKHSS